MQSAFLRSLGVFQKSASASCMRGLGHPACVTIRVLREMREHAVISLWFGIVSSLILNYAFWASHREATRRASRPEDAL